MNFSKKAGSSNSDSITHLSLPLRCSRKPKRKGFVFEASFFRGELLNFGSVVSEEKKVMIWDLQYFDLIRNVHRVLVSDFSST